MPYLSVAFSYRAKMEHRFKRLFAIFKSTLGNQAERLSTCQYKHQLGTSTFAIKGCCNRGATTQRREFTMCRTLASTRLERSNVFQSLDKAVSPEPYCFFPKQRLRNGVLTVKSHMPHMPQMPHTPHLHICDLYDKCIINCRPPPMPHMQQLPS